MMRTRALIFLGVGMLLFSGFLGCTVKAVGDPKRPITIDAHITIDIKGLKDTATGIEDYVSSGTSVKPTSVNKEAK